MSVVVHPYLWSASSFYGLSTASAGNTIVSGLSALFNDCVFLNSRAQTRSGGEFLRCLACRSDSRINTLANPAVDDDIPDPASGSDVKILH